MLPRRRGWFDDFFNDRFFRDFFNTPFLKGNVGMETDVREKDGKYLVDINLPGFSKEDVKVSFQDGYLTVEAKTEAAREEGGENERYLIRERYSGAMTRSFYIGEDVKEDEISASFRNGILTLEIPKKDAKAIENRKYIEIK